MNLPTDAAARKAVPVYSGFVRYFPKAMAAVAALSRIGNDQHNPGEPLHWAREKSGDELDACMRHLMEAGTVDTDGVRHSTKAAWRAMANLEKELEANEAANAIREMTVAELYQRFQAGVQSEQTFTEREQLQPLNVKPNVEALEAFVAHADADNE